MGFTLVEVMIACAMFLVVLGVLSFVLITNFRYFKIGESEVHQLKSARSSLNYMSKVLRESRNVYNEDALKTPAGSSEIIFDYRGKVCSFKYNDASKEIEYFEYEDYADPQKRKIIPESVRPVSLKTGNIKSVVFKIEDVSNPGKLRLITIEETANPAVSGGNVFAIKTKVLRD